MIKVWVRLHSHLKTRLGKLCFWAHSDCWQSSLLCRLRVSTSHWLLARDGLWSLKLTSSSCHVVLSMGGSWLFVSSGPATEFLSLQSAKPSLTLGGTPHHLCPVSWVKRVTGPTQTWGEETVGCNTKRCAPARFFFFFFLLPPPLRHIEVPEPGVNSKLELQPMAKLRQPQILNPLLWARDWTHAASKTMPDS